MTNTKRLVFLDVFRGATIAAMILVNNPGSWNNVYSPLLHANWDGCTPTDLIFPFFIFIVGVSISLAIGSRKDELQNHRPIIQKIVVRTFVIFLIGILLNLIPAFNFDTLRIPGVLQRIAVVYGITALLFLKFNYSQLTYFGIGTLVLYWLLMAYVPVPDGNPANLEPATNLGAWLDRKLLGGHLWSQSKVWDPEGILSTLPALSTSIIGILTGLWIKKSKNVFKRLTGLFAAGAILLLLGLIWGMFFPINKQIWTSSYVLYTGGIAMICLAMIHWIMDIRHLVKWSQPFKIMGMNALFVYILSGVIAKFTHRIHMSFNGEDVVLKNWMYLNFESFLDPFNASLLYAMLKVTLLFFVAWWLWKRKIFIKV